MATMYSTTRPLMLLAQFWHRVYIIVFVLSLVFQEDLRLMEQNSATATARPTALSLVRPIARASHPKPLQGGQQEVTRILPIT